MLYRVTEGTHLVHDHIDLQPGDERPEVFFGESLEFLKEHGLVEPAPAPAPIAAPGKK